MGIWIRSQNKVTLTHCTDIFIAFGGIDGTKIKSGQFVIGRYENEEQAMFVMNMIEEHINQSLPFTFEMPSVEETKEQIAEMDVYFTPVDRGN